MPLDAIVVRGAREHNLKNIDVTIPRDKLVVITGLSGSGKSSLAFDTIYAEGQRRYVESLSAYARQFLGQMEKPDVDSIDGLSPAISIDQKGASRNPRSTVGTVTEIYDYLRLLFARAGRPHCPNRDCPNYGQLIERQTVQQIVDRVLAFPAGRRMMVLAPVVKDRKGEHERVFEDARRAGFVRVRVNGEVRDLSEELKLTKNKRHTIEVVVDRLMTETAEEARESGLGTRLSDSVETALKLGGGIVLIWLEAGAGEWEEEHLFSELFACTECGTSLGEIEPRSFSFNSPHGACPTCTGLGIKMELDPELVVDAAKPVNGGALVPWAKSGNTMEWFGRVVAAVGEAHGFTEDTRYGDLNDDQKRVLLYGTDGRSVTVTYTNQYGRKHTYQTRYEGLVPNLERRYRETDSDWTRSEIERYMAARPCPACNGKRLKPEALAVTVADRSVAEVTAQSIVEAQRFVAMLAGSETPLNEREQAIAQQILKEIAARLAFLVDVGLDYLTLDRQAGSLSGGEAQRIRLATQIGSSLMGVLYVCDEPSIGLHPIDDHRLIRTLERLRDLGNTVLIVEHDEAMMRSADWIVDMGPGAGEHGGRIIAEGTTAEIMAHPASLTGAYLSGRKQIPVPAFRRSGNGHGIMVRGARENNLKNVNVWIPLGKLVCITGVSGSGKSSLVEDILYRKVAQVLYNARERPGAHDAIEGLEHIDKVVDIYQSPIGRTPRSNPATYTGAFTPIRELFAGVPEARMRGYAAGRFSFNVKGGRCEACKGDGYIEIQMQFLPDVTVPCEVCHGARYNREALEIHYKGKSIAEVLNMTVEEGLEFFKAQTTIRNKLETMAAVGLGYIRLGQPATTLSGGEAQRVKLSTELSRRSTGKTLYILDEPTTGLSFEDTAHLLTVLQRLVDAGNTVVVIEHNLDVIKCADWLVDLGPQGGYRGGEIVVEGTPEDVARVDASYTGQFLRPILAAAGKLREMEPDTLSARLSRDAELGVPAG
ncbi:MAG: excinuclease ABC subunit UvrA [Dehalococcoidia bacterium]